MRPLMLAATLAIMAFGQPAPPSTKPLLGTILRSNGTLIRVLGTAQAPEFEADPSSTKYLFFAQSDALACAAISNNTLIFTKGTGRHSRIPLASTPRALAISPNAQRVAVAVGNSIDVYAVDYGPEGLGLNRHLDASAFLQATPTIELAVKDSGQVSVTIADKTYFAGLDKRFTEAPKRLTHIYMTRRGSIGYDPEGKGIADLQYNTYSNRFAGASAVAAAQDGIGEVTGLHLADGKTLWVSQTGENNLVAVNTATREVHPYALNKPGVLRLSATPGIYFWDDETILDTTALPPTLVPIAPASKTNARKD